MEKKYLFVVFIMAFILTGCRTKSETEVGGGLFSSTKTMDCTKVETDEDNYKTTDTTIITYNNSKVLKIKTTVVSEIDPSYSEFSLNIGKAFAETFNKIDGMKMEYEKVDDNKIQSVMEVDFDKIDPDKIKEVLGDLYDEDSGNIYSTKNITIDEFKKQSLEGYTCK